MKQYTVTYRTARGFARFAFLDADSVGVVRTMIEALSPGAIVLTVRENNPALTTVTGVSA